MIKRVIWRDIKLCAKPFFHLFGFLAFFILNLIWPVIKIGIGKLESSRIGEISGRTELFLRRRTRQLNKPYDLEIFVRGKLANHQLFTMFKKKLHILENKIFLKLYDSVYPYTRNSRVWIPMPFESNEYEEFSNIPPQLSFTEEEKNRGNQLLATIGIVPQTAFVCFHARDKAYLDITHSHRMRKEWAYHDFRDCDIGNYLLAARYLASKGIYAIRMGAVVEKKLGLNNNDHIIDYATYFRSDFGDVYVSAKCKFFLGSDAGLHIVPTIFNVPVALANAVPLGNMGSSKNDIFIPKRIWLKEERRFLTFKEIIKMGADWWLESILYEQAGIEVIENSANEILDLAKEMNERLDRVWVDRDDDNELQQRFRLLFSQSHRCYGFMSRIGAEFLRQNKGLLE